MDYISIDDGRRGYISQSITHYSSCNSVETVDGDCRRVYRPNNIHSSPYNPGDNDILLRLFVAFYFCY